MDEELIKLGAEFINITVDEFKKRIDNNPQRAIDDWKKYGIGEYDKHTEANIYGLVGFNDYLRIDNILHSVKYLGKAKILDFGGGIGLISSIMSKNNTIYYYDLPSKTREFAKYLNKKIKSNVIFIDSEEEAFKLDINFIICVDVLEHLTNPIEIVKKFTDMLPSGGLFLTTGLDFSTGDNTPMHLVSNLKYKKEYNKYMYDNYRLMFFHSTQKEIIYLWTKK